MNKFLFFEDVFIKKNKIKEALSPFMDIEFHKDTKIENYECLIGFGSGCFKLFELIENSSYLKDVFLISCYLDFDRFLAWTASACLKEIAEKIGIDVKDLNENIDFSKLKGKKYFLKKEKFKCKFHLIYGIDNKLFSTDDALKIVDLLDFPRVHLFEEGGFAPFLKFPEYFANLITEEINK
ncbi:MAG: hypothetical protein PWQ25_1143 [Deferribacteres bacterium]|jgi:hypothetical protein|nr:hypothetical protein [Deferribacteraceae bacterium]MDK2792280.1 hypothetical protein [Deferribacteres bacterium]